MEKIEKIGITFVYERDKLRQAEAWREGFRAMFAGMRSKGLVDVPGTFRAHDNGKQVTMGVGVISAQNN